MGTDRSKDTLLFRQYTKEENAALATTWGHFPRSRAMATGSCSAIGWTRDRTICGSRTSTSSSRRARLQKKVVTTGEAGQAFGTVIDGTLYLQTTKGAPKGRVVAAPAANPAKSQWHDVVKEQEDAVIEGATFGKGVIAVTYLKNASNTVSTFDPSGKPFGAVQQPGIGASGVSAEPDRTEAFLTFTSFNHPTAIFRIDLRQPATTPELWQKPDVPVDPSIAVVEQVWYPSKDGTKVSMFLVHQKGYTKQSGGTPTLLTGYGGFNINETPVFSATLFQWFEAGGLFALPNLRGGGEYGDAWHEAGMLQHKQNTFDDFIAAAEWLIAQGYTTPEKLAIRGGSNGGLLVGAAITQRPELFRVAICEVPLLDMLRYQDFLMARYWVPEYGSAESADQFKFLLEYSPYQHVKRARSIPRCISRPAKTTAACTRCTRARWPRSCRPQPRRIRPSGPCCSGSIATPATVRASR
jgi:prolyl oligopeptidase